MNWINAAPVIRSDRGGMRLCDVEGCMNRANNAIQLHVNLCDPNWMDVPAWRACDEHRDEWRP